MKTTKTKKLNVLLTDKEMLFLQIIVLKKENRELKQRIKELEFDLKNTK